MKILDCPNCEDDVKVGRTEDGTIVSCAGCGAQWVVVTNEYNERELMTLPYGDDAVPELDFG